MRLPKLSFGDLLNVSLESKNFEESIGATGLDVISPYAQEAVMGVMLCEVNGMGNMKRYETLVAETGLFRKALSEYVTSVMVDILQTEDVYKVLSIVLNI